MPYNQMLLGMPYYGYLYTTTAKTITNRDGLVADQQHPRRNKRHYATMNGNQRRTLDEATGSIDFSTLVNDGVLTLSSGEWTATGGFTKYWNDCSDTPYMSNGKQLVAYDDTDSLYDKAAFAAKAGLGGASVWSIEGDTSKWALTLALRNGMGLSS